MAEEGIKAFYETEWIPWTAFANWVGSNYMALAEKGCVSQEETKEVNEMLVKAVELLLSVRTSYNEQEYQKALRLIVSALGHLTDAAVVCKQKGVS